MAVLKSLRGTGCRMKNSILFLHLVFENTIEEDAMFETGIRQFRMAMSMVWGKPINPRNIERLIEDALKTLREFGTPGDDAQQLLDGPFSSPDARRGFQTIALQRTLRRLMSYSPYYYKLFASCNIEPDKL